MSKINIVYNINHTTELATITGIVESIVRTTLDYFENSKHLGITILITDDTHMRELNLAFMGKDTTTDVLSFNEDEGWYQGTPPKLKSTFASRGSYNRLGDVAICLPQIKRQAQQNNKNTTDEVAMLTVHGILHLLGYDHEEPEESELMFGLTNDILNNHKNILTKDSNIAR